MKTNLFTALRLFIVMTVLTGIAYPLLITAAGKVLFPKQANGSILAVNGKDRGSSLVAQKFEKPEYFWGRPSGSEFGTIPSGASNLSPTSDKLVKAVKEREAMWREKDDLKSDSSIPTDLLTASGSGLDPHISPEAARLQIHRVAEARGIPENVIENLVANSVEPPQWGIFGEPRINVLLLNIAVDSLISDKK